MYLTPPPPFFFNGHIACITQPLFISVAAPVTCHVTCVQSNEYSKERMFIVMKRCILLVITVLILKTDAGKYENELNHAYIK